MFYTGGIYDNPDCGTELDHSMLITGYGNSSGINYWTLKNSWGSSWGEQGYVRIQRSSGNVTAVCGINLAASYPECSAYWDV